MRWSTGTKLFLISPLFALTACQTIVGCPPLVQYTPETMKRAAAELKAAPVGSALAVLATDYGKFRAACRVK